LILNVHKFAAGKLVQYIKIMFEGIPVIKKMYLPKSRTARVFVHFHSRSVVDFESFITNGTHPPNTYILFAIIVELCNERGKGACPKVLGFDHVIVS